MIKVLVVDDSALMRALLTELIDKQRDMKVVAAAPDPFVARELIKAHDPDVVTLDVEMPRMNGLDFLEKLMRLRPTPVLMISSLTARGSETTLRALELGAVDFLAKPALDITGGFHAMQTELAEKIRLVAAAHVHKPSLPAPGSTPPSKERLAGGLQSTEKLILLGASTGGCEALTIVLRAFPPDAPGTLVTQHMPPVFTKTFAARLNAVCRVNVKEAEAGERIMRGHVYIAPGGWHLLVARKGADYVVVLTDDPPRKSLRPAVNYLFESAARVAGKNAVAAILTGMGDDGADGIAALHRAGAYTVAQDERSCVVFGMPKAAIATGEIDAVVTLEDVADTLFRKLALMGIRGIRV